MRRVMVLVTLMLCCSAAALPAAEPGPTITELVKYVTAHRASPEEYVISKFADHDVVILGEFHRVKHDQELIRRLIPLLYKNDVHTLGWEFARSSEQPLIDSLLGGKQWDEALGRRILFLSGVWGYQEYLDILMAGWQLNASLPHGQQPFRILGISCPWDYSVFRNQTERYDPELMKKAFGDCTEVNYADPILEQVKDGSKVLVHCGMHHAFTRYQQPMVDTNGTFQGFIPDTRMGKVLFQKLGSRVFSISMHSAWYEKDFGSTYCRPVSGMIDSVMLLAGPKVYPCGFDVVGTPFGRLGDTASAYRVGYPNFRLADFCDGYIFQKPFGEYEVARWISDFVNDANVAEASAKHYNLWYRGKGVEDFSRSAARQRDFELWWYQHLGGK